MIPPLPANESERLDALYATGLLDTPSEQEFDDIVRLAAQICGTPISAVSLVDRDRQWFKASLGLPAGETRDIAFCAHAILDSDQPLVVPDVTLDPRFADNTQVIHEPHIRLYAGAPLVNRAGLAIGSLCVKDTVPRTLDAGQIGALAILARQVMRLIDSRRLAIDLAEQKTVIDQHAIVATADPAGQLTSVNDRFCEISRYTREATLSADGNPAAQAGRALFAAAWAAISHGTIWRGEVEGLTGDGQPWWVQATVVPIKDAGGRTWQYTAIATDITERKTFERELQHQRTELRTLVDHLPAMIWFKDTRNNHLRVNRQAAANAGRTVAEVEGTPVGMIYPQQAAQFYVDDLEVIHSGRPKLGIVETITDSAGHQVWLQTDKIPYFDSSGNVSGILVVSHDVTERRRAEETLQRQKNELRLLFDYIPAIICFKDTENRFVRVNRWLADSLGKSVTEIEGRSALEIFPAEGAGFYADDLEVMRSGQPKLGIIETYRTAAGQDLWLQTDKVPVHGADGIITGIVVMSQDITARKQAEAALRRRQTELQVLFDLMPALIWFKDTQNNFLRANRHAADAAGLTVTEMENKPGQELYPLEAARYYADDLEVIRSGKPKLGIVEPLRDRHGREIWIQTDKVPYRDGDGSVVGIVVMAQDVTAQRRANIELAESKRFLRAALDALSSHIAILDEHGTIIEVNAAWRSFATENGYSGNHGLGSNYLQICGSAAGSFCTEASAVHTGIRDVMSGLTDEFSLEYPCHSSTEKRWFMLRVTRFAGNGPVRVAVAHENVTARKLGEENLRLLGSAIDQCTDAIVITDARPWPAGPRIQFVNAAFTSISGYSAAEVIGRTPRIQQGPLSDETVLGRMVATLARGEIARGETISYRKDGSTFDLEWHVAPVRSRAGEVTHFVSLQRDISARNADRRELLRAREEALESARLKSRFLANMSHELRTPLNTINGLAATLIEQDLPSDTRHSVGLILQCGESLLGNIQTILTHSSLEAGQARLDKKPFALADIMLAALRITGEAAARKGLDLDYLVAPASPASFLGDPFRLQQVLVNLLANAVKFTDRGRVCLRVRAGLVADGRWQLHFTVGDTGIGLTAGALAKLFVPFAQADDSATRRHEGTGLGLAITKSLIELMGGRISVRSRPGVGSVFRFSLTLPTITGTPAIFATPHRSELTGRRFRLDDPATSRRRQLADMLAAAGARVAAEGETCDGVIGRWPAAAGAAAGRIPVLWLVPGGCKGPAPVARESANLPVPFSAPELTAKLSALFLGRTSAPFAPTGPGARAAKLADRMPLRILAADDIRTNREVLRTICRHLGYQVALVENGAEVLREIDACAYDLILLDVQMPVMDGLAAAREICRRHPIPCTGPRLVAITASVQPGDRERCLAAGMDDYLAKPLMPKALSECIERVCSSLPPPAEAPPPLDAAMPSPWVDLPRVQSMAEGLGILAAVELLTLLHDTVQKDFFSMRPQLAAACGSRHADELMSCVHGLKGCLLSVGWNRMGRRCTDVLAALRENRFTGWDTLPAELDRMFEFSSAEMRQMMAAESKPA